MHNIVTTVFKTLGLTILVSVLVAMAGMMLDIYTMTTKVTSTAILMQGEIAKHNGLPSEQVAQMFAHRLCRDVIQSDNMFHTVQANFGSGATQSAIMADGSYAGMGIFGDPVSSEVPFNEVIEPFVAADYGDTLHLVIRAYYDQRGFMGGGSIDDIRAGIGNRDQYIEFKYSIPCLYFNK